MDSQEDTSSTRVIVLAAVSLLMSYGSYKLSQRLFNQQPNKKPINAQDASVVAVVPAEECKEILNAALISSKSESERLVR